MAEDTPDIRTSPDGRLRIEFHSFPMRMSHEVWNPRVIHVPTGKVLLDHWDTLVDGQFYQFDERGCLHMHLREYDGRQPGDDIVIDPDSQRVFSSENEFAAFLNERQTPNQSSRVETPPILELPCENSSASSPNPPVAPRVETSSAASSSVGTAIPSSSQPLAFPHQVVQRKQVIPWAVLLGPPVVGLLIFLIGGKLLIMWTPLSRLPSGWAWWIGGSTTLGISLIVGTAAFIWIGRNYKGD
jgi:hypothetical protein